MLKFFGAADCHACHVAYRILCSAIVLLSEKKKLEPTPCAHILSLYRSDNALDKRLESVQRWEECDSESVGYWRESDAWRLRRANFSL